MNKEYELPLYRVVQELLNNAMKHSEASKVNIALTQRDQTLFLVYQDNGIGMDMTKLKDSFKTIGLAGIKERINSIDGTMEIYSTPGNGMKVLIELKLEVMRVIKVLIVDDHPAVGEGTRAIVEQEDDMKASVIADSEKYLDTMNKEKYEVYLLIYICQN